MTARRVAATLGLVALSVTLFVTVGEALARALRLVDRLNGFPRRLYVATDDPELPYVMRPGFAGVVRGASVRLNALGLRSPEVAPTPAPGVRRVLVLGDSATFGDGLPVEATYPARLAERLAAADGGRWEVVNAGVQGYNAVAESAWFRAHGAALRPAWVIVGFNLNDYDDAPVLGPLGVLTQDRRRRMASDSLWNRSELLLVLRWVAATRGRLRPLGLDDVAPEAPPAPGGGQQFGELDRAVSAARKAYYRSPPDVRWSAMVDALGRLAADTRAAGARLVVAIVPDGDQVGVPAPDLAPQRRLERVCAAHRIACLDLHPAFAAAAGDGPLFRDVSHPNAAGHRVIAAALAERLLGG